MDADTFSRLALLGLAVLAGSQACAVTALWRIARELRRGRVRRRDALRRRARKRPA